MVEKSKVCEEVGASVLGIGRQGVVDGTRRAMGEGREAGGIDPVPGTSTEHPPPLPLTLALTVPARLRIRESES